jgi:hypothetical protein
MTEAQRQQSSSGTILLVIGALCILSGLFLFSQRADLAEFFLGAQFLLGVPATSTDALKVLLAAIGTGILVLKGVVILAAGVFVLSRNGNVVASERTAAPTHR